MKFLIPILCLLTLPAAALDLDALLKERFAQYEQWYQDSVEDIENEGIVQAEAKSRDAWIAFTKALVASGNDSLKRQYLIAEYRLEIASLEWELDDLAGAKAFLKRGAVAKYQDRIEELEAAEKAAQAQE